MGDMVKGNIAVAEAAVRAGVEVYAGYPITPSTEAMEYLSGRMPELGRTFVQAESELAGINIIMGASACGHRVLTASSGPGISLKQEGIFLPSSSTLSVGATALVRSTARRPTITERPAAAATAIIATLSSAQARCRSPWT